MAADRVIRAMTDDGAFRVIVAVTSSTVRDSIATQHLRGPMASRLAELITGAVLVRETTAPGRRVQLVLRYQGGARLVADSLPDGTTRGLVTYLGELATFSGEAMLMVNYTLPNGALHQGIVEIPDQADVSAALMRYMQESEQTVSVVVVESVRDGDELVAAGGYLVQLLPEATREMLRAMTERVDALPTIAGFLGQGAPDARELLAMLFAGFVHTELADSPVRFGCTCSEERVLSGMASLPPDSVASMVADGKPLEVRCDACGRMYQIDPAALGALVRRMNSN